MVGSGCSTGLECTLPDQEVVGSNSFDFWLFFLPLSVPTFLQQLTIQVPQESSTLSVTEKALVNLWLRSSAAWSETGSISFNGGIIARLTSLFDSFGASCLKKISG